MLALGLALYIAWHQVMVATRTELPRTHWFIITWEIGLGLLIVLSPLIVSSTPGHKFHVLGGGITRIGDDGLFMAAIHVAHDCRVGNGVIMANHATLGGHVEVPQ